LEEANFEIRIRQLLDSALADSQYTKEVQVETDTLSYLTFDTRIDLLRIIQEAMTNVIKHAKARHVSVLLYQEDPNLILSITDDGIRSFSKNVFNGGIGIQSMRDRAEQYGGKLTVESNALGTHVIVSIPAPAKTAVS